MTRGSMCRWRSGSPTSTGLNEAVQLQPALAALAHRIIHNGEECVVEEQVVSRGGGQRWGKLVGVAGEQVQRNGLRRQVGTDVEKLQPRRVFVANSVQVELPHDRDRSVANETSHVGQHGALSGGEQVQILIWGDEGAVEVGRGL